MRLSASLASFASVVSLASLVFVAGWGCSEDVGTKPGGGGVDGGGAAESGGFDSGAELRVPVPAAGRVHVKLGGVPSIVTPADPQTDRGWDMAFEGLDVFTNSGPSGGGASAAFGPVDTIVFLEDVVPAVPFLSPDTTGGAFLRWWFYGGAPDHALYSRYHVYGIKDGARSYKVQISSYYGVRSGAPTSALYKVRWAELTATGALPMQVAENLDGSAGGSTGPADAPVECLDLGTGARTMLSPTAARASSVWHLCFRRQDISVNGEVGGPRGVTAADLHAAESAGEQLTSIIQRDDASEQARFDKINLADFQGPTFRGDRIVSAFGTLWLEPGASPPAPSKSAWVVVGADGKSNYLLGFVRFEGATATSPGTIVMRVKPVT